MAELNAGAFLAEQLRASAKDLAGAAAKMPDDRLSWHPETEGNSGRDALDQIAECAFLNRWVASAFTTGTVPEFDGAGYEEYKKGATRAAIDDLVAATDELATAVSGLSSEKLAGTVTNPFTKQETSWAALALFFYWNNVYHEGQINYIQVLYGDMS